MNYPYLEKYKINELAPGALENSFYPINWQDISKVETKLQLHFPKGLIKFWQEIGYGFFRATCENLKVTQKDYTNRLLTPKEIYSIITEGADSELILEHTYDLLEENDIPFFHVGNYDYMVIKRGDPNGAVYFYGTLIEPKFEDFIHNLYYKSPVYYLDKLED